MPQKCGISLPAYGADIHNMHAWQRKICMHAIRTADGDWILLTGRKPSGVQDCEVSSVNRQNRGMIAFAEN